MCAQILERSKVMPLSRLADWLKPVWREKVFSHVIEVLFSKQLDHFSLCGRGEQTSGLSLVYLGSFQAVSRNFSSS